MKLLLLGYQYPNLDCNLTYTSIPVAKVYTSIQGDLRSGEAREYLAFKHQPKSMHVTYTHEYLLPFFLNYNSF